MTREQEAEVIRRVQNGDANAYEALVTAYEKNVYNLALRMTGNAQDAEDMAQEAFLKAYNSLDSFRGDSKFSVWLYRIVSNVCLDFLRRQKRRPATSLSVEDDEGEDVQLDIPDDSQSPQELLERKLTREAVRQGLAQLPEEQRQILLLREIQGLSYEEIGLALSLEPGTVKSRIFRARKRLCAFMLADGNIPDVFASSKMGGGETP
ncbi:MAG: sigma-70 family RNA polymerase sigma factor [Oscillospiraceae bacterium]|nr:sigma-70 family RNA polymerase sigma factor [Oscillospiraceae bacterium]